MLRDEHAAEWTRGLDVIFQVGETSDMVPAPEDFPKCGSFVGPDYFLIQTVISLKNRERRVYSCK